MSRRHPEPEQDQPAAADLTSSRIEPTGSGSSASEPAAGTPATTASNATPSGGAATPSPASSASSSGAKPSKAPRQTLAGRVWVFLAVAAILLVLVIIFIAENTKSITISFLGAHGHISEALALLLAVVVGIVICLLVGSARILQLSLEVRRQKKTVRKLS
jgi:uncharacterized integral membrane protein